MARKWKKKKEEKKGGRRRRRREKKKKRRNRERIELRKENIEIFIFFKWVPPIK